MKKKTSVRSKRAEAAPTLGWINPADVSALVRAPNVQTGEDVPMLIVRGDRLQITEESALLIRSQLLGEREDLADLCRRVEKVEAATFIRRKR